MARRNRNTREMLMKSAAALFHLKGYSDTSIREITQKAGITNSIIYHYFNNKEELLFEIIMGASKDLLATMRDIEEKWVDPVECIRELIRAHAGTFGFKKEARVVISDSFQLRGKQREVVQKLQREIYDLYMKKLVELQEMGLLKNIDLTVAAFSIFGMINSSFRWYREGGRLSRDEAAEKIMEIAFQALLRDECLSRLNAQTIEKASGA